MATTTEEGFRVFVNWLTPKSAERMTASLRRNEIFDALSGKHEIQKMLEVGSLAHSSGVHSGSAADYLIWIKGRRPLSPERILPSIARSLGRLYPEREIRIEHPGVIVSFPEAGPVGVIPAFASEKGIGENLTFSIPSPSGGWTHSDPTGYADWFDRCNDATGVRGGARGLSRIAKAWKRYREVPISSFYLEVRAAEFMASRTTVIYPHDVRDFFRALRADELAPVSDPTIAERRISPCAGPKELQAARELVARAAERSERALIHERIGESGEAFANWTRLFGGHFPSYY